MPAPTLKPQDLINDLVVIAEQIEAYKASSKEQVFLARGLNAMADRVMDDGNLDLLADAEVSRDSVTETAKLMYEWAEALMPTGATQWSKEEVDAKLSVLSGMAQIGGFLSDEQVALIDELKGTFSSVRRGSGERSQRQPMERIEGRPEKVQIADRDGNVIASQIGNTKNSASNLKSTAKKYYSSREVEISPDEDKALLAAIKKVTEGGGDDVSFGGLTFSVVK